MGYRLGLDIGTNSLGWALWELREDDGMTIPVSLRDLGVRVFSDGRNPKSGDPLAVERRLARSMRRRRDRQLERRRRVIALLVKSGLFPVDSVRRQALKLLNPYQLRAEALKRALEPVELGRALYHLAVRRGFLSNKKEQNQEKQQEETGNLAMIQDLWKALRDKGTKTLGDFLWTFGVANKMGRKGEPQVVTRFRRDTGLYPERKMYTEEFDAIQAVQERYFPNVPWNELKHELFFQRPLRPVERGHCTFFIDEYRAWTGLPSSQQFRYLQIANNLKVITSKNEELPLTKLQLEKITQLFETKAKVSTAAIKKLLGLPNSTTFNYENRRNPATGQSESVDFKGNETSVRLRKKEFFGETYNELSVNQQDILVELIINSDDQESFSKSLKAQFPELPEVSLQVVSRCISPGTLSVSTKFAVQANVLMREGVSYHEVAKRIFGHHSNLDTVEQLRDRLPYYGEVLRGSVMGAKPGSADASKNPEILYGKINNPTVHIALNQLRKLVNALIERHGHPQEIVVELARELPMGTKQKIQLEKEQRRNREENEKISRQISVAMRLPAEIRQPLDMIRKHKLWVELGAPGSSVRQCVYCGQNISAEEAYGSATEVDHILPYSRTLLDYMSNKILAHKRCNQAKGNRTPFEAFGHSPTDFNWDAIVERSTKLSLGKRKKFLPNAIKEFDDNSGFIERQLNDTRYITKMARQYLGHICPTNKIWTANGNLTSDLRYFWGLNTVVGNTDSTKHRADHRHHALDAVVLGLIDRRTIKSAADANQQKGDKPFRAPFAFPMSHQQLVDRFKSVVTSHKPDHGLSGAFFQETAYGKILLVPPPTTFSKIKDNKKLWDNVVSQRIRTILENGAELPDDTMVALKPEPTWVSRKPIESIVKMLDVERIVDPHTRATLKSLLSRLEENSIHWKKSLQEFKDRENVRTVRYVPKNQDFIALPKRGAVKEYKGYQVADYLCAEIWFVPGGKKQRGGYQAKFVSRYEAAVLSKAHNFNPKKPFLARPHPAARFICQLYKYDTISIVHAGINDQVTQRVLAKVCGYSATQNKLDIRPDNVTDDIESWQLHTNNQLVELGWRPNSGQNYVAVNTIFGELKGRKEFISIDSKWYRR